MIRDESPCSCHDEEDPSQRSLVDLCGELLHLGQRAESLGLFVDDRDLLTCPQCRLQEDVLTDGRLVTIWNASQDIKDTGSRFADMGEGRFSCPRCQAMVEATCPDGSRYS